jgi:hypothetical protein
MAETPKAEDETQPAARDAATETGDGGAAPLAEDSIADPGDDTAPADTVSAEDAHDHIKGGAGTDVLDDGKAAGPWSASPAGDRAATAPTSDEPKAEAAKPEVEARRSAPKRERANRFLVILVVLLIAAGGGYATYPMWRDQLEPYAQSIGISLPLVPDAAPAETAAPETAAPATADPAPAIDLSALESRLADLEAAVAALAGRPAPTAPDLSEPLTALNDRVSALEARLQSLPAVANAGGGDAAAPAVLPEDLAVLERRLADVEGRDVPVGADPAALAALSRTVDGLEQRLSAAEGETAARVDGLSTRLDEVSANQAQGRGAAERAGAFLLAANLLAATSTGSGDFSAELNAVSAAAPATMAETVEGLAPYAGGVASLADLRARMPQLAADIVDASIVGADESVIGTMLTSIASLVTLRRTETAAGDDLEQAVNRAEAAATAGDLVAAVDSLSVLDGDPAKVAAGWLDEARSRIAVDAAVRALQSAALAAVAGS